jgi:hypothetical protein
MHRRYANFLLGCLVIAACAIGPLPAQAQSDSIDGPWQQIQTNAGACPTCRLAIEADGPRLIVTANNGWSATLVARPRGDIVDASGTGRWSSAVGGAMAGKPFHLDVVLKEQRLHLTMTMDMAGGRRWTVKAVYGRVWFGA